jgi:hypothetical protein
MSSWYRRCPFWQLILSLGLFSFLGITVLGAAGQWLFFGHLDFSTLVGSAVGGMVASILGGWAWRVGQTGSS